MPASLSVIVEREQPPPGPITSSIWSGNALRGVVHKILPADVSYIHYTIDATYSNLFLTFHLYLK